MSNKEKAKELQTFIQVNNAVLKQLEDRFVADITKIAKDAGKELPKDVINAMLWAFNRGVLDGMTFIINYRDRK